MYCNGRYYRRIKWFKVGRNLLLKTNMPAKIGKAFGLIYTSIENAVHK